MALWEFTHLNKHNNFRTRMVHSEGSLKVSEGFGPTQFVNRFAYEHTHKLNPPILANIGGKKYLMPDWIEVHPKTTLKDIIWNKPKPKAKAEVIIHKFTSSKGDKEYTTKEFIQADGSIKYSCTCPGVWRAKDKRCKHIKNIEK